MKKTVNILLAIGMLFQNFAFAIPVLAEGSNETSVDVVSITQNGNTLELKEGKYEVLGVNELTLNYKINNPKENVNYDVKIVNNISNNYSSAGVDKDTSNQVQNTTIWLDRNRQESDYTLKVCELNNNWECVKEVAEKRFVLNFANYDNLNYLNSKLVVSKVEQGGIEIKPTISDWYVTYNLNNIQDVELTLVGENLDNNTKYQFYNNYYSDWRNKEYTGSELKNGIKYVVPTNIFKQKGIQTVLDLGIYNDNIETYYKNDDGRYILTTFYFSENEIIDIPNITIKHQNKELEIDDNLEDYLYEEYNDIRKITPNEYNEQKPLTLNIQTQDLEDKDYKIEVSIYKDAVKLFEEETNINGLDLNEGYNLDVNNFILEIPKEVNGEILPYEIYVNINGVTYRKYLSYRENGKIDRSLFYSTGEKTIIRHAGWGGFYGSGLVFEVNDKAFSEYKTMYFHYLGTNFESNTTYNYEIYYGENDDENFDIINGELISKGTITGKDLNENGVILPIEDKQDYFVPAYKFVVKKGNNLVYYDKSELRKNTTPTLTTIKVKSNNKNVYMQMSNYKFIATKNAPLTIAVDGIGFDETQNYTYRLYDSYNGDDVETYTFSGKDINNGTASFKISKGKDSAATRSIGVEVIGEEGYPISWGGIEIEYVDSKKYFPTDIPYVIDNAKDLIKSIKKETNVNDFVASLNVNDDGNIKVYDNTGKTEITGNVGTGMIARITDEYDNNIMDLDVVVKGDVSGDGNITITDLVNVVQHLADAKKLNGVYEIAGNVTDTGEIGITDVIQISQDVADIKEVQ